MLLRSLVYILWFLQIALDIPVTFASGLRGGDGEGSDQRATSRKLEHQGESNVHISGYPLPMRNTSRLTSLWLIPVRFVGPTAFDPQPNPVGVIRCELFSRLTLPSLASAVSKPPPRTRVQVILINSTAILEPTCAKVIEKTKKMLGRMLSFAPDAETYLKQFTLREDLLFITRFDSDDAVGPGVMNEIHSTFLKSNMPLAIISPFAGNLYYPFAGDGNCGQLIYNTLVRKFPIFQTNCYDKVQMVQILGPEAVQTKNSKPNAVGATTKTPKTDSVATTKQDAGTILFDFFLSEQGQYFLPYHYDHKDPEEYFRKFRNKFSATLPKNWICEGIPGIIYTQTGLQSSLARLGHTDVDTLKYHRHYDVNLEKLNPGICDKGLAYFGVKEKEILELRAIYKRDKAKYAGHMGDVFVKHNMHRDGGNEGDKEGGKGGKGGKDEDEEEDEKGGKA